MSSPLHHHGHYSFTNTGITLGDIFGNKVMKQGTGSVSCVFLQRLKEGAVREIYFLVATWFNDTYMVTFGS